MAIQPSNVQLKSLVLFMYCKDDSKFHKFKNHK